MSTIAEPSTQIRFSSSAGLSATEPTAGRVDRAGGKYGAGLIRGVSVLTRGEALGHGFWVDAGMLQQGVEFMQAANDKGLKCRFTHPGLCADGLAKKLGILMNPELAGDQVLQDLHFNTFAHRSPDGDLAGYVMDRAEEEPEHFGTSIVFVQDMDAVKQFMLDNGGVIVEHDDGWETYETIEGFKSPDPLNVNNLPHARILELWSCDVVDDPAANAGGLFHRDLSTIQNAEGYLDYAFGLSDSQPENISFGVDPDRARQFLTQWATSRGLSLPAKGDSMLKFNSLFKKKEGLTADPAVPPTKPTDMPPGAPPKPEDKKDETAADATPIAPDADGNVTCPKCGEVIPIAMDDGEEPEPISDAPQSAADYAAAHGKYTAAFGADAGTKYFLGKVKFSDAQKLHFETQLAAKDQEIASLKTQLKSANDRLAFFANEGAEPLAGSPAPGGTEGGPKGKQTGFAGLFKAPK